MSEGGHDGAWYCGHRDQFDAAGSRNFCPPEGCPKGYCARDEGWNHGDPTPDRCLHIVTDRTAAMDALIADSADMIDAPDLCAKIAQKSDVERVARAIAEADANPKCGKELLLTSANYMASARKLATAALSAMSPAWQDIATAPRDGTYILLRFAGPFHDLESPGISVGKAIDREPGWWLTAIWASTTPHQQPTHWMAIEGLRHD